MKFTLLDINSLLVVHDLAHVIWPSTYQSILQMNQIEFMLKEIYSINALQQQVEEGQKFVLVTSEDGENIGFLAYSLLDKTHAKLNKLYLQANARGKGLGKQMIDWVAQQALSAGNSFLTLNVHRENKAVQFYQKMGFEIKETVDIPFGEYTLTDYIMEKKIA